MRGTLLIATLRIRSSYLRNIEEVVTSAVDVPDTVQWWIGLDQPWRIRTFALDHDIHTHSLAPSHNLVELAWQTTRKTYGDVIAKEYTLAFSNCQDKREVVTAFKAAGIPERLEVAAPRFAFWKPDDARYWSQSKPE